MDSEPRQPIDLRPGQALAERYRLEHVIGEGGMGVVWAAVHTLTRRPVALKVLKRTRAEYRHRFLREARIAGAVRHPGLVEILDVLELEGGILALVMERLHGESLAQRIAREGRLPADVMLPIACSIADAVGAVHAEGVVHRDLKPENVFLCDGGVVKVLDFGIAKLTAIDGDAAATAGLTRTGAVLGTPHYMAPEQVFGERDVDARADVWAFGVLAYEALSGIKPFSGDNFGQIFKRIAIGELLPLASRVPALPPAFGAVVDRALSRDRERRYADMREVARALRDPLSARSTAPVDTGDGTVRSIVPSAAAEAPPPARRRPRLITAAAVAMAACTTGIVVTVASGGGSLNARAPAGSALAVAAGFAPGRAAPGVTGSSLTPSAEAVPRAAPTAGPGPSSGPGRVPLAPAAARPLPRASAAPSAPPAPPKLPGGVSGDSPY